MDKIHFDSIVDIIYSSFNRNKNKIAIIEDKKEYTYNELKKMSDIAANNIIEFGLDKKKIALYIDKSVNFISLVTAIWKTGGTYIPIDTEMPKARIDYMIQNSGIDCIVKDEHSKFEFKNKQIEVNEFFKDTIDISYDFTKKIKENDIAYVIYTSGSTGNPKGVKVSNNNLTSFMYAIDKEIPIDSDDKCLTITTACFDISILEIFFPIIKGITLVIGNKRMLIDMYRLKETIKKENITIMQATPITWYLLASSDTSVLKNMKVLCGGDKMDEELSKKLYSNSKAVWNLYGPTETTIWSSVNKLQYAGDTSIGRPMVGTNFYLFDENMKLNNVAGELYIGGVGVSQGYINNLALTNQKYIKNPLNEKEIIYRTGDYVEYNDGKYYCIGRNDFQIKLNGHRIELEDIEKNLMNITGIETATVIPNNEKKCIYAFVKINRVGLSESYIKELLRNKLVEYMIPRRIFIIDEIPLTFNKKIDRKALLSRYVYNNDKDISKNQIVRTWSKIIGEDVDADTPYSEYSIDSLTLTQLSIAMEKIWKNFSIEDIIKYKTINNIIKQMNGIEQFDRKDNKRINKILSEYHISLKDVKFQQISRIEKMMLNFYFLNPKSYFFQDCYIFVINQKLDSQNVRNAYMEESNKLSYLKSKYIFGQDIKMQSNAFKDLIKYEFLNLNDKKQFKELVDSSIIENNNINSCAIKLKNVVFSESTYLIFNYPHIRMDELSFFDLINSILEKILKKNNLKYNKDINVINMNRCITWQMDSYQKEKCIEEAKKYKTNINNIVEYYILAALKMQYNNIDMVHYVLNTHHKKLGSKGNEVNICSTDITNVKGIREYLLTKKTLCEKTNNDILITYNDISKTIIGSELIKFEHIENNDFNINIEIYNKKNSIETTITLKENYTMIDVNKLRNDLYEILK